MSKRSVLMRHRVVAVAFVALAGLGLGACEQIADLVPDSKRPLPGERKLLFPDGVPGVTQGVPPEMIRRTPQAQDSSSAASSQQSDADAAQPQQQEQQAAPGQTPARRSPSASSPAPANPSR